MWQALLPIAGGIAGNLLSQGDRSSANNMSNAALAEILGVSVPDVDKMKLTLTPYQIQGMLDSVNEKAVQAGPSELANISTDPRLAQAQMQALQKMQAVGNMGLTPAEQVQSAEMQRQAQAAEAQRQAGIMQNMKSRGVGGGGTEAAARLMSAQNMANQVASSSDKLRADAFNRALQATSQAGTLGGQIRTQEFNEQDRVASAKDAINKFNADQRSASNARNAAAERSRQASNLAAQQRVSDSNTEMGNKQQQYNTQLAQQDFNNRMTRANAVSGAYNQAATQRNNQADSTANMWAGIGAGAGRALSSATSKSTANAANTNAADDLVLDEDEKYNNYSGPKPTPFAW